ncbi:MAG: Magnesium-transporting ATPase, P-type 1 [Bacteroidetes bacterium ADurb.Bin174]|nr:MAG: Magnesium-transporting ATPase, P-type 1 [Bacteroidetes bacterium ADurb.Bin174]
MTGSEFAHKSDQEKKDICLKFNAFSRILPEQKFEIIKFLQNDYEVGYMGDGINDAPALKIADVSIAVQDAVDSAREAADVILLQKSLYVIIDGIAEGRKIFANTFKYVKTTVASNFGNFYALSIITLLIDFLPMLPLHLLMVNLLSDFPMIAISTDAVDEAFIKKPTHYQAGDILIPATILGVVSSVFDLIYFALFKNNPPTLVQTGWFTLSILTEIVFIYSIRTERFFLRAPRPSMPLMLLSCIACVIAIVLPFIPEAQKIFTFMPMQPTQLLKLCGLVAIYFVITETVKCAYYHQRNNHRRN